MTVLANGAVLQIESYTAFPKGVFKRYPRNSDSLIKAGEYNVCFKGIQKIHGGYLLWGYLKGTKPKIELLFVSPDGEEYALILTLIVQPILNTPGYIT